MPSLRLHYSKYSLPLLHFLKKNINYFAYIKNVYIFAMSIKTKPTDRVAGIKKLSYENTD